MWPFKQGSYLAEEVEKQRVRAERRTTQTEPQQPEGVETRVEGGYSAPQAPVPYRPE